MLFGNAPINPILIWWLGIYALTISVIMIGALVYYSRALKRGKRLLWDVHTEYVDVGEFSNRNIPLQVTYKGTEPRWLSAAYLMLRNVGHQDIVESDSPDKQHLIIGHPDARYIGFNRLISDKAKVNLTPLFMGAAVYCKLEFDRLGPGDEILCSLLFVSDEKMRVALDGKFFGQQSKIIFGYRERLRNWRLLWWLLITVVVVGLVGALVMLKMSPSYAQNLVYQTQILAIGYFMALATAAVLLRPIRYWQQIHEKFYAKGEESRSNRFLRTVRFMFGRSDEF